MASPLGEIPTLNLSDSIQSKASPSCSCSCDKITVNEIPGAQLPRAPEKCKLSELRIWLKSRCQTVKSKESKAELCLRVKQCMESRENFQIVDPYPGQPYMTKKMLNCSTCQATSQESAKSLQDEIVIKDIEWSISTKSISQNFSYIDILEFAKRTGKNTKAYVEKPIERGYAFFHDGYVFDQLVAGKNGLTLIKAKCYRSMKKNESPHIIQVTLDSYGKILSGKCSCVAGVCGQCNHVFAVLYSIDHSVKIKQTEFKRARTCTEKPAEWTKSRTEGIRSEPVMTGHVRKPKYGSSSDGVKSSLYEARAGPAKVSMDIDSIQLELRKINPLFGFCLTVGNATKPTKTKMGFTVPKGSPLSYQLAVTEGDFSVCEHLTPVPLKVGEHLKDPPRFPWTFTEAEDVPAADIQDLGIYITSEKATEVFDNTKSQSHSEHWFAVRKNRLTASKFGHIIKRKKDKNTFIRTTLLNSRDISHLPAVKYGKDNEVTAVQQYASYMTNKGRKTKVLQSGCVINPLFPWLAATPDGIVYNSDVGYGLLEIKCSYTNRNITPAEACMDPSFFCSMVDGNFQLNKEHEYYAQVQGQLGICGATYCDFVVFTNKGLGIQRILFDENFWRSMVQKLRAFFVTDFAPVVRVLQKAI